MRRTSVLVTSALVLGAAAALGAPAASSASAAAAPVCAGYRATIVGTSGSDILRGTPKRDVIAALGGDDRVVGLGARDILCGGRGADRMVGGGGTDIVLGGRGEDVTETGRGGDIVFARAGDSTQTGRGADVVVMDGGELPASTELGGGHDLLLAEAGRSEGQGGAGIDTVALPQEPTSDPDDGPAVGEITLDRRASFTSQTVQMEVGLSQFEQGLGSRGVDTLTGNADANYFDAGPGRDVVQGLGGNDELYGGAGRDSLDGGEGTDRCPDPGETTVRIDCERPAARAAFTGGALLERWNARLAVLGLSTR